MASKYYGPHQNTREKSRRLAQVFDAAKCIATKGEGGIPQEVAFVLGEELNDITKSHRYIPHLMYAVTPRQKQPTS